jgi:GLPGLI family protein
MKYYIIILLIGLNTNLFSQIKENNFKIDYEMYIYFENQPAYSSTLLFNNKLSKFEYSNNQKEDIEVIENNNVNLIIADTTKYTLITSRTENKRYNYNSSEKSIVVENINPLSWTIINDTVKKIGTYNCSYATTLFRGRKFYVWFTSEINTDFGPWKLNGLPGLILEAIDETKEVAFYLKSIENYSMKIEELDFLNKNLITEAEYKIQFEKKIENLESKIKSKASRGDNIKVEIKKAQKKLEY